MFTVEVMNGHEIIQFEAHQIRLMAEEVDDQIGRLFCDTATGQETFDVSRAGAGSVSVTLGGHQVARYAI